MTQTLREIRNQQGIGIRRLSKGAPVAPRTIYGIENGDSTPNPETIRKISRYLKIEDPMEVTEFRSALESQGLDALPEESEPTMTAPPPSVEHRNAALRNAGWSVIETDCWSSMEKLSEDPREQALTDLRRLMYDVGRFDSARIYRELYGEEPTR